MSEHKSPSHGRSEYAPFVLESGKEYELIIFGDQPFYVAPDVKVGERFRITFRIKGGNCPDNHGIYGNCFYSGVSYVYEGGSMYFGIDGTGGCRNDILVISVHMEAM